ncbi:uncharacterized protein [Physcomitrium patens]|nr:titin homolog isoform X2 [Physcomitrium patens]XP_024358943.1 titin homolog isoform X2 [Physcomitrium patens]XP_024358944.1 titin homolog isoform X2 [Physcomitrium patens]|eukprot:XP_024358942.1 titin homolog isoform X2 [Physcomitrella patens]
MGKGGGLRLSREQYSGSFPATRVIPPPKASSAPIITGVSAFSKGKGILHPLSTSLKDEDDDIDTNVFFDQLLSGVAASQEASTSESGQATAPTRELRFCYYNIKGLLAAKKSIIHVKAKPLRVVEADISVEEEPKFSLACNPGQNFPTVRSQERIRYIRKQVSIDPEEADSLVITAMEKPDVERCAVDVSFDKEASPTHSTNRSVPCMKDKLLATTVPISTVRSSPGAEVIHVANKTADSGLNLSDVKKGKRGEPEESQENRVQIVDETPEAAATLLMLKEESQSQMHAFIYSSTSEPSFLPDRDRESDDASLLCRSQNESKWSVPTSEHLKEPEREEAHVLGTTMSVDTVRTGTFVEEKHGMDLPSPKVDTTIMESGSTAAANQGLFSRAKDDNLPVIGEGLVSVPAMLKETNNAFSDIESGKSTEEVVVEKEDEVDAALPLSEEKEVAPYLINEAAVAETPVVDPRSTILGNNVVTKEAKELVNESEADNINSAITKDSAFAAANEISQEILKPDIPFQGDEEASPFPEAPLQISDDIAGKPLNFYVDTAHQETQNNQSNEMEPQFIEQSSISNSWRSFIQDLMSESANSSGSATHQVLETVKDEVSASVNVKSCGLESKAFTDAEEEDVMTVMNEAKSIEAPLSVPHQIKVENYSDAEETFKDSLGRETEKVLSSEIEEAEAQLGHDTAIPMLEVINETEAGVQNSLVQDKDVELPLSISRNSIDVKEAKPNHALNSEALYFQEKFLLVKDAAPLVKVSVEDFEELKSPEAEEKNIEAPMTEVFVQKAIIEETQAIEVEIQEAAAPVVGSPTPEPLVEDIKEAPTTPDAVAGIAPFLQEREVGLPLTTVEFIAEPISKSKESLVLTEEAKAVSEFKPEIPVVEENLLHVNPETTLVKAVAPVEQPLVDNSKDAKAPVVVEAFKELIAEALVTKPNIYEDPPVGQSLTEESGEPLVKALIVDPLIEENKEVDSASQVITGETPVLEKREVEISLAVSEPVPEPLSGLISSEKDALASAPARVVEMDVTEDSESSEDSEMDSEEDSDVSEDSSASENDSVDIEDSDKDSDGEDSEENSDDSDEDSSESEDSSCSEEDRSESEEESSVSEEDVVKKARSVEECAFGEDTIPVKVSVPVDEASTGNLLKTETATVGIEQEVASSESANFKCLEREIEGKINRVSLPQTTNEENDDESSLVTKDFVEGFATPVAEDVTIADPQASVSEKSLPVTETISIKEAVDEKPEVLKSSAVVEVSQLEKVDASPSKYEFSQAPANSSTEELPQAILNSEALVMDTRSVKEIGVVEPITNRSLELGVHTIESPEEAEDVQIRRLLQESTVSGAADNQTSPSAEDGTCYETSARSPRIERKFSRSKEASVDVHSEDSEKQDAKSDLLKKVDAVDHPFLSLNHSEEYAGVAQVPETDPTLDKKWSQEVSVDVVLPDEPIEVEMDSVDERKASTVETEQSLASEKPGSILDRVGPVYENLILELEAFSSCGKADESMEREVVCTQMESNDVNEIVPSTSKNSMLADSELVGERITRSSTDLRDERNPEKLLSFADWHEEKESAETADAVVADTEEEKIKVPGESKGVTEFTELSKQLEDTSIANGTIKEETQRIWNLKYLKSRPVMAQPRIVQPPKLAQSPQLKATTVVGLSWPPAPLEGEEYTDSDDEATNPRLVE